jgi:hypothetical protein
LTNPETIKKKKKNDFREIFIALKRMTGNIEVKRFMFNVVLLGFTMTLADSLIPLQIEELHGSRKFSGLTTLISILGGIPIFYFSGQIYGKRGSWSRIRTASKLLVFRLLFISFFVYSKEGLVYLLGAQLFHGATFALIWSASTEKLQRGVQDCNVTASVQTGEKCRLHHNPS